MRTVSFFEVACTSYVHFWRVFRGGYMVNDVCLDAVSIQWALWFEAFLAVACLLFCRYFWGLHDFLVMCLENGSDVFGTAVG